MVFRFLKFTADWCGPCKRIAVPVKELSDQYNLMLKSVDVDNDPENLSLRYKVEKLPTILVLDTQNKEVDRITGADLSKIEALFKTHAAATAFQDKKNKPPIAPIGYLPMSDDAVM